MMVDLFALQCLVRAECTGHLPAGLALSRSISHTTEPVDKLLVDDIMDDAQLVM